MESSAPPCTSDELSAGGTQRNPRRTRFVGTGRHPGGHLEGTRDDIQTKAMVVTVEQEKCQRDPLHFFTAACKGQHRQASIVQLLAWFWRRFRNTTKLTSRPGGQWVGRPQSELTNRFDAQKNKKIKQAENPYNRVNSVKSITHFIEEILVGIQETYRGRLGSSTRGLEQHSSGDAPSR